MPDSSLPGENGSGGFTWYLFWMIRTSGKLTLAALHRNDHLAGTGHRRRDVLDDQRFRRPVCLAQDSFHEAGSPEVTGMHCPEMFRA